MLDFFAPIAFLIPISRVLSVTETSIIFIIPTPAASKAITETTSAPIFIGPVISFTVVIIDSLLKIEKSFGSPGGTFLIFLKCPIAASITSSYSSELCAVTIIFTLLEYLPYIFCHVVMGINT